MRKRKASVKKGYVAVEIRSSMYDKDESLFLERMMSREEFGRMVGYICKFSEPKSKK